MNFGSIHFVFNLIEGIWWVGLGIGSVFFSQIQLKHKILLLFILTFFGISDFVEIKTGAWWEPVWLLMWKALCIGSGLILIILIYKTERRQK